MKRKTATTCTLVSPPQTETPVIERDKRMLLRHYLQEGLSKNEISRRLDVSRETVHRLIRTGQLDRDPDAEPVRYTPRPPVPTKLDPYRAIISCAAATSGP